MSTGPMIRINLLDWREARREQRKKTFFTKLGIGAGAGALVCLMVIGYFNSQLDGQNARNDRLKQEIKLMEVKIKEIEDLEKVRDDLIARTKVIETLQQSRSETVHFFDDLVSSAPEGVYLTRVEQRSDGTRIDGIAESNGRVSTYIRNIEAAGWLHDPRLVYIKAISSNNRRLSEFSLRVRVGPKKKSDSGIDEVIEG